MQIKSLAVLLSLSYSSFSQELKQVMLNNKSLNYYFAKSKTAESKKTLLFLHGSLSQFEDETKVKKVPLDSLLEMNASFIQSFTEAGYNCVFPIACGKYSWFKTEGEVFLEAILKAENTSSKDVLLSGFSDGATGSYRYFYKSPEKYKALMVFNAFPQLDWFSKDIDYKNVLSKKVIFVSQKNDKVIPYEFPLLEYRRQKLVNQECYFLLREGKHEFISYTKDDFSLLLSLLSLPVQERKNDTEFAWIFPAIDGLIIDNKLLEAYPFRKATAKKYGMDIKEYMSQDESFKTFNKLISGGESVQFFNLHVEKSLLKTQEFFDLEYVYSVDKTQKLREKIFMDNYFIRQTFE